MKIGKRKYEFTYRQYGLGFAFYVRKPIPHKKQGRQIGVTLVFGEGGVDFYIESKYRGKEAQ